MRSWKTREVACVGSVLFRGSIPPRLAEFDQFAANNVHVISSSPSSTDLHWSAGLDHPSWGGALVLCRREYVPVPRQVVQFDPRLSNEEGQLAAGARSALHVRMMTTHHDALRDRKVLLRYLRCLMGDDGVMAVDHLGHKFWTRDALDDELAHDADLDIDSLFITHCIHNASQDGGGKPRVFWVHTHGLAEVGALDFDILRPSPLLMESAYDVFRGIAFCILEGEIKADTRRSVVRPGGDVAFVSVEEFNRRASATDVALRDGGADEVHNSNRLIACDPGRGGWLARLRDRGVRPSGLLSALDAEHVTVSFSTSASNLMSDRARKTFAVFRRLGEELGEFRVKPLVKLGLRVDGGGPDDREHMWFVVKACGSDEIDGTLLNEPFRIGGLKAGDSRTYSLDVLTDWTIMTPLGTITPRDMRVARVLRANRTEILKTMKGADKDADYGGG